jgi:hypothetical protein
MPSTIISVGSGSNRCWQAGPGALRVLIRVLSRIWGMPYGCPVHSRCDGNFSARPRPPRRACRHLYIQKPCGWFAWWCDVGRGGERVFAISSVCRRPRRIAATDGLFRLRSHPGRCFQICTSGTRYSDRFIDVDLSKSERGEEVRPAMSRPFPLGFPLTGPDRQTLRDGAVTHC